MHACKHNPLLFYHRSTFKVRYHYCISFFHCNECCIFCKFSLLRIAQHVNLPKINRPAKESRDIHCNMQEQVHLARKGEHKQEN